MRSIPEPASPFWQSYRQRSRVWRWPSDDELGETPTTSTLAPHLHVGAQELFVALRGSARLTVGRSDLLLAQGDVCVVPADTYHDIDRDGSDEAAILAIVAPNDAIHPFQFDDFPPEAYRQRPLHFAPVSGPTGVLHEQSGMMISVDEIAAGDERSWQTSQGTEMTVVDLGGTQAISMGGLTTVPPMVQHSTAPTDCEVTVRASDDQPARVLRIETSALPFFCQQEV